jgi:hypothetical protein
VSASTLREHNTSVHNRQVHVINEDENNEVAVAEEHKAEAQMRQSMKGAEAERMKAVDVKKQSPYAQMCRAEP